MASRLDLLAQRRQQLQARLALQREALAIQSIRLGRSFETIDAGMRIVDRLRNSPGLVVALAGGLLLLKPRRLLRMAQTGMAISRGWRLAAPLLARLLAAPRR